MGMLKNTILMVMGMLWGFVQSYPDNQSVLQFLEEHGEFGPQAQASSGTPAPFVLDATITSTGSPLRPAQGGIALVK